MKKTIIASLFSLFFIALQAQEGMLSKSADCIQQNANGDICLDIQNCPTINGFVKDAELQGDTMLILKDANGNPIQSLNLCELVNLTFEDANGNQVFADCNEVIRFLSDGGGNFIVQNGSVEVLFIFDFSSAPPRSEALDNMDNLLFENISKTDPTTGKKEHEYLSLNDLATYINMHPSEQTVSGNGVDGVITGFGVTGGATKTYTITRSNGLPPITGQWQDQISVENWNTLGGIPPDIADGDDDTKVVSAVVSGTNTKTMTFQNSDGTSFQASWNDLLGAGGGGTNDGVVTGFNVSGTTTKSYTISRSNGLPPISGFWQDQISVENWNTLGGIPPDIADGDDEGRVVNAVVTGTTTKTLTITNSDGTTTTASWTDLQNTGGGGTSGDNWGTQTATTDNTIFGNGAGSPLGVNLAAVTTYVHANTELNDLIDVNAAGLIPNDYVLTYDAQSDTWHPAPVPTGGGGTGGDNWGSQVAVTGTYITGNGASVPLDVNVTNLNNVIAPDWNNITNMPPGFADGVDNTGGGGTGGDNWGSQVAVTGTYITGNGSSVPLDVSVNNLNNVIMPNWSNLTNVPTGFADGIDNTGSVTNVAVTGTGTKTITITNSDGTTATSSWTDIQGTGGTGGDNWGTQVAITDNTLNGDGANTPLSVNGNNIMIPWPNLTGNYDLTQTGGNVTGSIDLDAGTFTLTAPTSTGGGGDNWGTQTATTDNTIFGNGAGTPLSVNSAAITPNWNNLTNVPAGFADGIDNVNDGDSNPNNEYQNLFETVRVYKDAAAIALNTPVDVVADNLTDRLTITGGQGIEVLAGASSDQITIQHAPTSNSPQGSVNNSGTVFIQDITLDAFGHITSITSVDAGTSGGGTGGNIADYISNVSIGNPGSATLVFTGLNGAFSGSIIMDNLFGIDDLQGISAPSSPNTYLSWNGSGYSWSPVSSSGGNVADYISNVTTGSTTPSIIFTGQNGAYNGSISLANLIELDELAGISAPTTSNTYLSWNGSGYTWSPVTSNNTCPTTTTASPITIAQAIASSSLSSGDCFFSEIEDCATGAKAIVKLYKP